MQRLLSKLGVKFAESTEKGQKAGVEVSGNIFLIKAGGGCGANQKKKTSTPLKFLGTDGFVEMKQNNSSEVIPLRPRESDAKGNVRTQQTCLLSRLEKGAIHRVISYKSFSEACIPKWLFFPITVTSENFSYSTKAKCHSDYYSG